MSYDLYFARRDPGQSWDEALESSGQPRTPDLAAWDTIVAGARDLLGEVRIVAYPPNWELDHEGTGIAVNHWEGGWEMSVPYWTHGEEARRVVGLLYEVASLVERESGFECFDPQLGLPIAEVTDLGSAVPMFDAVADRFGRRGGVEV
ncbi:hypothetical protein [Nonomuraea candida]|uniref:hypothetical protein n=1 Tax=Nonomuraea candida TaxID=359159 RepID=UPI0005BE462E|nr:hypothetical protein [Nonomuraea candida]